MGDILAEIIASHISEIGKNCQENTTEDTGVNILKQQAQHSHEAAKRKE